MKRLGNLYEKVISIENIQLAERKAGLGKSKNREIIEFRKNLNDNILEIHKSLLNETYKVSEYYRFLIHEPKRREISKLPYIDRIVHHCIINILESIFLRLFTKNTYSCIKGRGISKCMVDLSRGLKDVKNTTFCLKIDIRKFYQSVNHKVLIGLFRNRIKDEKLLNLLNIIINSISGLPLGSFTSQWFANFYLNDFDHWLKREKKIQYYYKYCDDLVILHSEKHYLQILRREIQQYLKNNLKLELSNYQVFPISRGIDFLGYVSFPTHIKLRKSIKVNMIKTLNERNKSSFYGWCVHADCNNLIRKYGL